MSNGWGVLVAQCDKSRSAKHLDRSVDRSGDVTSEPFREQPDIELRLTKTIVGRMLMNAEGTSRAQTQVADILIDMPSGASSMLRPRTSRPGPRSPVQKMAPPNNIPEIQQPWSATSVSYDTISTFRAISERKALRHYLRRARGLRYVRRHRHGPLQARCPG